MALICWFILTFLLGVLNSTMTYMLIDLHKIDESKATLVTLITRFSFVLGTPILNVLLGRKWLTRLQLIQLGIIMQAISFIMRSGTLIDVDEPNLITTCSSMLVGGIGMAFIMIPFLPEAYNSLEVQPEIKNGVREEEMKAYISKMQVLIGGIAQGIAMFFGQLMIQTTGYLTTYLICACLAFMVAFSYYLLCGIENPENLKFEDPSYVQLSQSEPKKTE